MYTMPDQQTESELEASAFCFGMCKGYNVRRHLAMLSYSATPKHGLSCVGPPPMPQVATKKLPIGSIVVPFCGFWSLWVELSWPLLFLKGVALGK